MHTFHDHGRGEGERLRREREFHDRKYRGEIGRPRHYRQHPTAVVLDRALERLANVRGLPVIEYGCGDGWVTAELLARGAAVLAFDLSPGALSVAANNLGRAGGTGISLLACMPAERLAVRQAACERAVGFAILHHLELAQALPELQRVLMPGGRAVFAEPLGGNPALRLYRRLTPRYRTPDERPLDLPAFLRATGPGWRVEHEELFLLALLAFPLAYIPGVDRLFGPVAKALHRLDRRVLRRWPALGAWAWYSVIVMEKA